MSSSSNTEWIMEDEEELLELYEAYTECRDYIDRRVPRKGYNQANWIVRNVDYRRWASAHDFWFDLRRDLEDPDDQ